MPDQETDYGMLEQVSKKYDEIMQQRERIRELEHALESTNREFQSYKSYYESEKSRADKLEQENAALRGKNDEEFSGMSAAINDLKRENAALKFDAECHARAVARDAEQYEALRAKLERAEIVIDKVGVAPDFEYCLDIARRYFEESNAKA